jgi:hypothetical protein
MRRLEGVLLAQKNHRGFDSSQQRNTFVLNQRNAMPKKHQQGSLVDHKGEGRGILRERKYCNVLFIIDR